MKYFDRFPIIDYDGNIARNILTKVDFSVNSKTQLKSRFDFIMDENSNRADIVSFAAYGSSYYDWLVYLSNSIVDPYHDYHKSEEDMDSYMKMKYSGQENARRNIVFYRNNWPSDTKMIEEWFYRNLDDKIKKYYSPVMNDGNQIIGYKRTEEDWVVSTNRIILLHVASAEWVPESGPVTQGNAKGNIVSVDVENNTVTLNHIQGNFIDGPFMDTTINSIEVLVNNIPEDEMVYWEPVSAYDMEYEENELKRYISLVKSSYLQDIDALFEQKIKEN